MSGQLPLALDAANKAVTADPKNAQAYFLLATIQGAMNRNDELAATLEKIGQALLAAGGIEDIVFFDPDPGQFPALAGELVAQARELLLFA